jgi:hypothetical protein
MNWVPFSVEGPYPPERRCVLVQFERADTRYGGFPPAVVVGYLRYAAGDKDSPYFVTPGFDRSYELNDGVLTNALGNVQRQSTHWCDCLGDDFEAPLWAAKDMNRSD